MMSAAEGYKPVIISGPAVGETIVFPESNIRSGFFITPCFNKIYTR